MKKTIRSQLSKQYHFLKNLLKIAKIRTHPIAFLFGAPEHANMGDQAQTYCIQKWIQENYPNHRVAIFVLGCDTSHDTIFQLVKKMYKKGDMLICHSGYHLTDLYTVKNVYFKILETFPDNPVLIFPQTIFFKDEKELLFTAEILNRHSNLMLLCRDEKSHSIAMQHFYNCKLLLFPDVVTSLIGTKVYSPQRKGVLFCMRNDIEAFYSTYEIDNLRNLINSISETDITDTTSKLPPKYIIRNREKVLEELFAYYSKYKLIITDRYHGTIFSLIAATPVIVLSSTDHKLSSGVKWFPEEYSEYVMYAKDIEEAYFLAKKILKSDNYKYRLSPYFREVYYNNLSPIINL